MKICVVAEGCYPYVVGGVSSWIHSLIKSFPNIEFVLLTIVANRSQSGIFAYELPENLTEVHEVYLEDFDWEGGENKKRKFRLNKKEYRALRSIVLNQEVDWDGLFQLFREKSFSIDDLLMGPDFFHIARECYKIRYPQIVFSDFLWTLRSIYLPLFLVMKTEIPQADLYHCVATGYAGVLGSMAKSLYQCGLLISEHGIYTREREEEIIKAEWVEGIYKNIWIEQFKKMSKVAYDRSDMVTSLYEHARSLQIELGCSEKKTLVTPNGIDTKRLANLPGKEGEEAKMIHIGAVLRVTPIKDVKTMIQAFAFAKEKVPNLKLWIMGPCDEDKEYAQECFDLVETLHVSDVVFTGRVDIREYLGRMDMTILTSISEGQPLTILESYAAKKPVIATDVGNCRELLYGNEDGIGSAGILTHIMNLEEISDAMVEMAENQKMRLEMGVNGYKRLMSKYKIEDMKVIYQAIYKGFAKKLKKQWEDKPFVIEE
nr:GT4 family glycosyltransferase PelF [Eubacterium sp.]